MLEQVGRYRIERELGRGGMGIVYLADDPMLHRQVAIKTIDFSVSDADQRDFFRKQLLRDARAAAGLTHPNIVTIHDVVEQGEAAYLVMEFIPGETLSARLRRPPKPELPFLLGVLREMASALDYTHSRGVIHRDVKPANVMIEPGGRTRIMDFGIARLTDQRTMTQGLVAGTVQYMAPEQIKGEAVDGRTDQFSLAAVAYLLLTGKALFEAQSLTTLAYKIVNDEPEPANVRNPQLPPATAAVLSKALSKQPAGRFGTCAEFVDALRGAFEGPTLPLTAPAVPPPKPARSRLPWVLAASLLALSGAFAVWFGWNRHASEPVKSAQTAPAPIETVLPPPPPPRQTKRATLSIPAAVPTPKKPAPPVAPMPPAEPALQAGNAAMEAQDYKSAIRHFSEGIAKNPNGPVLHYNRGLAYMAEHNPELAVGDFEKATQLRPEYALAWLSKGNAYLELHRPDDALSAFVRSVELNPKLARAHLGAGQALMRKGAPNKAIDEFTKAIEINPLMPLAYQGRARAKERVGDPTAKQDFEHAKQIK